MGTWEIGRGVQHWIQQDEQVKTEGRQKDIQIAQSSNFGDFARGQVIVRDHR